MSTRTPLSERPLAFVDCETTGLDPHEQEVIEIAILKEYPDGRLEEWETKTKPQRIETAHPKALEINGYAANPSLWDDAPTFDEVAATIAAKLDDCIIVGHNPKFDLEFLKAGLKRAGSKARLPYRALDTVTLAYEHLSHKGLESLSLDAICTFLGISNEGHHTALVDAHRCREVWHTLFRSD